MRIRPNLATFRTETRQGVGSALRGVAKTVATIAGVAGGIRFFQTAIKDAAEEQRALAALRHSVLSVGAAYTLHGRSLDEILGKMEVATGIGLPELAQGFLRLVTQTKSSRLALRDLGLAEDVALARHLRVAQSAVILARAEGGSATALRRLGIIIPTVTAHSAALTREHERAKAAGVKFTAQQELGFKAALAQAGALDKQASKTRIITEIQRRFGGQTEVFAKTAAGEAARFHESFRNILEDIGNVALPGLSAAAEHADVVIERLRENEGFDHALSAGFHSIGQAGHIAAEGVAFVAPALTAAAHAIQAVLRFTDVGGLLAFAAGWKAVGIGVSVASGAERRYLAILAAGRGELAQKLTQEEAAAAAQTAHTAALESNTAALLANRAAVASRVAAGAGLSEANAAAIASSAGFTTATEREAAALIANRSALLANAAAAEAFAVSRATAGGVLLPSAVASAGIGRDAAAMSRASFAAANLTGKAALLGRGLLGLAGGPTTAVALGLGVLTFGLYKLFTAETDLERENRHLGESFGDLAADIRASQKLAREYSESLSSIKSDRVAVQTAKTNVALAEQALRTTQASRSGLEYRSLLDQLASAQDAYRVAVRTLARDEAQAAARRRSIVSTDAKTERDRAEAIRRTAATARAAREEAVGGFPRSFSRGRLPDAALQERDQRLAAQASASFAEKLDAQAASVGRSNVQLGRRIRLLADFARAAERIPTRREIQVAVAAPDFRGAVGALVGALARMKARAAQEGFASGRAFAESFRAGESGGVTEGGLGASKAEDKALRGVTESSRAAAGLVEDVTKAELDAARSTVAGAKSTLTGLKESIAEARQGVHDAALTVESTEQELADSNRGVREAARGVRDAQQGVADAIRQGAAAVREAVAQADQNLFSIGSSLSDAIDKFLDAQQSSQAALATGPEARELKRLRDQILRGQGGPETRKAAQELAARLEAGQAKGSEGLDKRKERIRREIADLVAEFNKGEISLQTFNRRIARLLAREHVSYRAAGQILGTAFADGFRAEVRGLLAQAKAIAAGPRRPGVTGLEPTIVKPLDSLRQTQKEIAAAQQRRDEAAYQLAQAGRRVEDVQERHQAALVAATQAGRKLAALQERHGSVLAAQGRAQNRLEGLQEQHLRFIRQQNAETNRQLRGIRADLEHRPVARQDRGREAPGRSPGFAAGGVAGTHGFSPGGGDTIAAWLKEREIVLNDRHQAVLARSFGLPNDPHAIFRAIDQPTRSKDGTVATAPARSRAASRSAQRRRGGGLADGVVAGDRVGFAAFGEGYEGWVRRPTVALIGEREPEYVTVTPRSRARLVEPLDLAPVDAGRPRRAGRMDAGDRQLVEELRELADLEERLARLLLSETRRQTVELRRIHETQRRTPTTREQVPRPRPGDSAARNARLATSILG